MKESIINREDIRSGKGCKFTLTEKISKLKKNVD